MRVAVTGASGLVGANLVRALLARGDQVRVLIHEDDRALRGLEVEQVRGDLLQPQTLVPLVKGADLVFHLAALISIQGGKGGLLDQVNVRGPRHIAAACLSAGVGRLVHFSSIHALESAPDACPIDEERPSVSEVGAPAYDRTKAAGEREIQLAAARGLDAVILNPTGIVGPFDFRPSYTGKLILSLAQRRLPTLVKGGFDWVDVRDVVSTALRAADQGRSGERYLLSGHWVSIPNFAQEVQRATGVPAPRVVSPLWAARLGIPFISLFARLTGKEPLYTAESLRAISQNSQICGEKARVELGHLSRPFAETISDTVRWLIENGHLTLSQ